MSEYEDLVGRADVCDSYSTGERVMRTLAGNALRSRTLADACKGAVGYFTVFVEIDKDHSLEFDGERWQLLVDTRGEYDWDGKGYGTAGVDYVYEMWDIEEPDLDLPVQGGKRGEDTIWFQADGWDQSVIKRVEFRKEIQPGVCPHCWEQIKDLPRQGMSNYPPPGGYTDKDHAEYHRAGHWIHVIGPDYQVIREECDRPGCEACPQAFERYVDPNEKFVGRWRRPMLGDVPAYVYAVVEIPWGGKWQPPSTVTVEMDWCGGRVFKARTHSTPISGRTMVDSPIDHTPTKEMVIEALERSIAEEGYSGYYEKEKKRVIEALRKRK